MNWRDVMPKTEIPPDVMEALNPVIEGQALFLRGQYLEAEAMYIQALDQFPKRSGGRVLIYNKLGILYEKMGNIDRALDSYEKSVKEGALTPFTYQRLCCIHLEAGRLPQALDCAQQGIKVLKKSRTKVPEEIYFWFIFQKLKWKIKRRLPSSQRI
jgi:tetratricopeptide (TPR) repeat protein